MFLGFLELGLALFAQGDYAFESLVGMVEIGGPLADSLLELFAEFLLFEFQSNAFVRKHFDVHHANQQERGNQKVKQVKRQTRIEAKSPWMPGADQLQRTEQREGGKQDPAYAPRAKNPR